MITSHLRLIKPKIFNDITRDYSSKITFKLSKNAAANHANDGKGNHIHVGTQKCTLVDCATKKCPQVCGQPTDLDIDGHHTHKPPVGRMARFVSVKDVNGDAKSQYFVPTNKKNTMTEQQKQTYGSDFKPDAKSQQYVTQHEENYD